MTNSSSQSKSHENRAENNKKQHHIRYDTLLKLTQKTLSESKNAFDIPHAIETCYGEDADVFGEDMLVRVIESMIDEANGKIDDHMRQKFAECDVRNKLAQFEDIVHALVQEDEAKEQAEENDRDSAKTALQDVRLPKDVTPQDVMKYYAYQAMKEERDALVIELRKLEEFNADVQAQTEAKQEAIARATETIAASGKELESSANLCSMVS
mmetsp:Transcript_22981/g.65124  ORF Transcript_22981/g.65124 Transcript_22981/m.65124 type:complete len:211 (-) Transcript_22981:113-745(-)|eukprot:CAMPEP_0119567638 /NCGR_PEP_ID=MMETSP1352-20130426/36490_1 /TAXON_ID=265584 /ORGANISM="Stauroneis constricta, Strain CCMP1120" /LENGTH=210 /DNA_ID=CAMNT_0007616913 /DNA_START=48 /DNA_END=680 /DNA_ORIENTATION=-